jgi:hypothetical protein
MLPSNFLLEPRALPARGFPQTPSQKRTNTFKEIGSPRFATSEKFLCNYIPHFARFQISESGKVFETPAIA